MHVLVGLLFLASAAAQTCNTPGGDGGCMNGLCPPDATCLQDGTPGGICCSNTDIAQPTTAAPTTAAPTAVPTAAPGASTAAPGACVDKINPKTGRSDCPNMSSYCTNSAYYALMTDQCPLTCNRCTGGAPATAAPTVAPTAAPITCVDKVNPNTGVSDCPRMAAYCTNSAYIALMTDQCPKTCRKCAGTGASTSAPSTCVDKVNPNTGVSDCPKMAAYCNNSGYYTLMTDQCPRTCRRCGGTGEVATTAPSATCVDKVNPNTGRSDCPGMAQYCNNSAYYTLMTDQCPRTCNRCNG